MSLRRVPRRCVLSSSSVHRKVSNLKSSGKSNFPLVDTLELNSEKSHYNYIEDNFDAAAAAEAVTSSVTGNHQRVVRKLSRRGTALPRTITTGNSRRASNTLLVSLPEGNVADEGGNNSNNNNRNNIDDDKDNNVVVGAIRGESDVANAEPTASSVFSSRFSESSKEAPSDDIAARRAARAKARKEARAARSRSPRRGGKHAISGSHHKNKENEANNLKGRILYE